MIILLDVDGTLVDYRTALPPSAADAVRGAIAAGHRVYLCTGRSRAEVYPHLWDLGVHGLIGGNGASIESDGVLVHRRVLALDTVGHAVDWLLGRGLEFYVECDSGLFGTDGLPAAVAGLLDGGATEQNIRWVRDAMPHMVYGEVTGAPADAAWRGDVNKISFVLRDDVDLTALASEFAGESKIDTWSLTGKGPEFGEFGQIGVNKGVAVELLAAHLGVSRSELVAFGDARNDLELLAACGTGVAMGQAPQELKDIADHVTAPVDEDGLAQAFTHLGLLG